MAENYKIELGVKLRDGDIQSQINDAQKTLKPIELKIDAETKELTNTIKEALNSLSKGTKNALTLDTSSIEKSLDRLSGTITDIKASLGTFDSKSGMKDLLSSINQIAKALGKAENESDSLIKSLSALSKKDLSFNLGIDMGKKNNNMIAYGRAARKQVIPELESQIKYLENLFGGQQAAMSKLTANGSKVGFDVFTDFDDFNSDSAIKKMEAMEKYINSLKKLAALDDIKLDGFNKIHKDASSLINDLTGVENAADKAEDTVKKFKNLFGSGGIDAEGLSASLDPIVVDLNQIREAVVNLSKGVSLEGLTQSFDRLSDTIENLLANAERLKGIFNGNLGGSSIGSAIGGTSTVDAAPIKSAQQTGKKIGETVTKSAQQSINLDDVIDKEVLALMNKFEIAGDKGSSAFKEIKQAVVECRAELNTIKNSDIGIDEEVFDTSRAIDKVTDAIANQHRAVSEANTEYVKLAQYVAGFSGKVHIPDYIKQEQGDDYKSHRGSLGAAFTTGKGQDFADFITELNASEEIGQMIDLTKGEAEAFDELVRKVKLGRQQIKELNKSENYRVSTASTEEILEQNGISREEISNDTRAIVDIIDAAEQQIAQSSVEMASKVAQSGEKIEQSYREIGEAFEKVSRDTSLVGNDDSFQKTFEASNQAAQEAQRHFQELLADEKAVVSVTEQFDDNNALQSFVVNIKRATGEVETLRYAMDKLGDEENGSFRYQSGSTTDRNVEKQFETRIKKANDLQIKLDKIKTDYENMGANKPIKEEAHIKSLSEQYDKVQAAIESVKNADNSTYASMVSNAEKEKAALESLVKVYRSAETFSTDLRAKDRDTAKEVYSSRLDVLSSKMRKDGVYDGLSSDVDALGAKISSASDVAALSEIANELTKLDAKYKSAKAAKDEFNRSQNVGSSVSGLRSEIEILQNASPSIKSFKTEINGAEVSIESLLKDLDQVGTKGDFDVVKGKVEAFGKAAEAAGIDLNEAKTEAKKANDAYKQMLDIQKQIRSLSIKEKNLTELGNTSELNEVSAKLKTLKSDYETLKKTFGGKLTSTQFGTLQAEIDETESELKQLDAKWADTKAKLAEGIKADFELGNYDNQISQMYDRFDKLSGASTELRTNITMVENAYSELETAIASGNEDKIILAQKNYAEALEITNNQLRIQAREESKVNRANKLAQDKASIKLNTANWLKENTRAIDAYGDEIKRLIVLLDKAEDQVTKNNIASQISNVQKIAKNTGHTGLTLWDKLINKVKEYSAYLSAAELFMYAEQALRSMFEQVKLIDTAMTELKKVTDETDATYNRFLGNAANRAKELGTTVDGLVTSTADFARLGYGFKDAQGLAEVANIYAVVGDEIDSVESATESLISTMAAFKAEANGMSDSDFAMSIVDKMNEVSNNYAISSGGLGEALERSSSAMYSANNTLDETIALITASNTVVQDADVVGNAYKTVALRIRGAKTELEEMGEDTSDMAESTSKLRDEILALSGVDIMEADGKTFKSTYDILDEISKVYHDLSDISQANILEKLAGKRQSNILSAALENFDIARSALETSMNSSGSALKEHEKWSQSIEARLNSLKAAWQGLSQTFLKSDFLKGLLDIATKVVDALEWIVDKFGLLGTLGLGASAYSFLKPLLNGGKVKKSIGDIVGSIENLTNALSNVVSAGTEAAETGANVASAATETAESTANMASATTEVVESTTNLASAGSEAVEMVGNVASASTEAAEAATNLASASTEAAEAIGNIVSTGSEAVETLTNIASAGSEAAETVTNVASAGSELAETGANVASASSEILEAGTNIASAGTEAVEAGANIASTGSEILETGANLASTGVTLAEVWAKFGNVVKPTFKTIGAKLAPLLKGAGLAGLAVAGASLVYNLVKKYKEGQAELRAETIETADAFLDSTSTFEKAYIKYSGKTNLTVEEENELKSAIDGTVDALGKKESALKNVISNSNDYVASLDRIAKAELEAAKKAADDKKIAAEGDLKEAAIGWSKSDGSEVDIDLKFVSDGSEKIIKEIADEQGFYHYHETSRGDVSSDKARLEGNASIDEIIGYYEMLEKAKERLESEELTDTVGYKRVTEAIGKMSAAIEAYTDGVYEAAKAEYKLTEGIPKTAEEYIKMRESILNNEDIKDKSIAYKMSISDMLDKEYGGIFDLSSAEVQARKFVGIIKGYGNGTKDGTDEIGTVETFLNMRTALNNNECTVSQYLSELDNVKSMAENFSEEERKEFNLAYGLDTDSIKEQYDNLYNHIKRNYIDTIDASDFPNSINAWEHAKEVEDTRIKDLLDSLTATELEAALSIRTEIDWGSASNESIMAQIEEEAKFIEAMNYTIAIDVETESLDALNSALSESVSATGLSSESITALKDRYAELASQGYDLSSMFEETSNGIHLNKNAVSEFEQALASKKLSETDSQLEVLKGRYDDLTKEIKNCTDAGERASLYSDQQEVAQKINDLATLASQYQGLASAYNAWQNVESSGNERDMYESIIEGFETVEDEIKRGWYDDGTIKFLELITGQTDLAGKSASELKKIWNGLDDTIKGTSYSVKDFFTTNKDGDSTSTGAYNFLRAVEELGKNGKLKALEGKNINELVERNSNGKIVAFDFDVVGGDKAVAEALGVSEEMVQIIQRTLDDAGFVVTLDGKYTLLADLKTSAEEANDALKKLQTEGLKNLENVDLNFDFNVDTIEGYQKQLEKATNVLDKFRDKNGKLKTDKNGNLVEGAKEALEIAEYYTAAMDKLTEPKFMQIDTSTVDEELQKPIEKIQQVGDLCKEKHLVSLTGDTEDLKEVQDEINKVAKEIEELDPEVKAQIGIDENWTAEDIADAIEKGEIEIPAELKLDVQMSEDLKDIKLLMMHQLGLVSEEEIKLKVGYELDDSTVNKLIKDGKQEVVLEFITDNKKWFDTLTEDKKKVVIDLITNGIDLSALDENNRKIILDFAAKNVDLWNKFSAEEQTVAIKFITENQSKEWFNKLSEGEQKVALEIIASGVDLNVLKDEDKEIAIKYVVKNKDLFKGLEDAEKEIAIKYVVENRENIEKLSEKEQKIYVKYIAKGENLEELTKEEREVLIKFVTDDEEWFNKLTDGQKKIAIRLAVENEDDLDKLTDEQKKVYIEYVAKNEKKFNELSEGDKKVFVNYIANGGDVDKFDTELKKRNRDIEIIAETHGVEDVEDLKSAMSSLTDEQVRAIAEAIGKGDVDALDSAVEGMDDKTVEAVANALGYDSVESLKSSMAGMSDKNVKATATTSGKGEVDNLNSSLSTLKNKDGTKVTITTILRTVKETISRVAAGGKRKAAQRTGADPDGSGVNGTANVNGTTGRAFKQGSWGTKNSGTALVGELGREVLVRDGKYYTIGDNGAEFIKYKKGDIIFNHIQSEELFKNGKVTSGGGRAKAFASGTTFVQGVAFGSGSGGGEEPDVNSKSVGSDSDTKDKFEDTIDWIKTILDRAERAIDKYEKQADNEYKTWAKRNKALENEIVEVDKTIRLYEQAKNKYLSEANAVGLDSNYAAKVRNGSLSVEDFEGESDEKLVEKIKNYQDLYNKYLDCVDKIDELKETEASLYSQRFDNVQSEYDNLLQGFDHTQSMLDEYINQAEAKGQIVSKKYYNSLISNEKSRIAKLKEEQADLIKARDEAVASGEIAKYSEEWYNMCGETDGVTQAIEKLNTKVIELGNNIRDIDWEVFDLIQERISDVTSEADFLIELMSNKDLYDDNGKLTGQGAATLGLHALNYNTYMYESDDLTKEIADIDKQLAKRYSKELEERRRELIELQRDMILAAEQEKDAIKSLVEESIELELDSLSELIDKYTEALDSQKDLRIMQLYDCINSLVRYISKEYSVSL